MRRWAPALLVVLAVAFSASTQATAEPGAISSKRAQATQVLTQIRELDSSVSRAIEAYNLANEKLDAIERDLAQNRRDLRIARTNLQRSQAALASQLLGEYTNGSAGTLDVLLGATSLEDLLGRLDTADRVFSHGSQVNREIGIFRAEVSARRVRLRQARKAQTRLVAERARHKASVESQLSARQRLYSSIRGEIERMQAAEQARQAEFARQAQARLVAHQATVFAPAAVVAEASLPSLAPPARYGGVVGIAMQYLGTPYVYGGASPGGFDCSGFVMFVFLQVGVSLPHNAAAQYGVGMPVSYDQLQPGDLVFFDGLGHNGIYVGGGQFIHSPHTGDVVKISPMTGWYASTYVGARRL